MLRPAVASAMRPSTNGVTAAPVMPAALGVGQRAGEHGVELGRVELGGDGDRHRRAARRRRRLWLASTAATSAADSTRCGTGSPDDRV